MESHYQRGTKTKLLLQLLQARHHSLLKLKRSRSFTSRNQLSHKFSEQQTANRFDHTRYLFFLTSFVAAARSR